ncbi:Arylacetamide deacetylase-like 2 [Diplodia seriata]|uniref:Arylacetamide deacetylase-like 2 n=1 Tax=Diplodia seriata TaxID=420778 RepID=A0A1S8B2L1_9PEZI|nr:Arylacetamide deacetylase-like 2 [Diplodia seriata]
MAKTEPPTSRAPRPRWVLHVQAQFWRVLMGIGMMLHRMASPRPPKPSFTRTVPTTVSPIKGEFKLQFYVPEDYSLQKRMREKRFPVVVNFHGGGFTLGQATDDARWCATVVREVGAVVVSVDYRRAPEHAFPTAVEDGVDAILYLAEHAESLLIDIERVAVSGFSSGGNMSLTVPLRLQGEVVPEPHDAETPFGMSPAPGSTDNIPQKALSRGRTLVNVRRELRLKAIVAWYPSTDYTVTREQRRMTCVRKDQELPAVFTQLFDESYLSPPTMDMSNPYLSPGRAPDTMMAGLPEDIIMFTCEWDMLLAEGERLRDRLVKLGKNVVYTMVPGVPHGWDKAPNPLRPTPGVQEHYLSACKELRRVFHEELPEGAIERDMEEDDAVEVSSGPSRTSHTFGRTSFSHTSNSHSRNRRRSVVN